MDIKNKKLYKDLKKYTDKKIQLKKFDGFFCVCCENNLIDKVITINHFNNLNINQWIVLIIATIKDKTVFINKNNTFYFLEENLLLNFNQSINLLKN